MFLKADHLSALLPPRQLKYAPSYDGLVLSVPVWAAELSFPLDAGWKAETQESA